MEFIGLDLPNDVSEGEGPGYSKFKNCSCNSCRAWFVNTDEEELGVRVSGLTNLHHRLILLYAIVLQLELQH